MMKTIATQVEEETLNKLETYCRNTNRIKSHVIRKAVEDFLIANKKDSQGGVK